MITAALLIVVGLLALTAGGEFLVRAASQLAALAGISPLVVGLTVVAFATSAPELAVALKASFAGQTDIAIGNVVGSNIINVLFILGISALIVPLLVASQLIRLDVPLMIGVSVLMWLMGLDGTIGRVDGLVLFGGLLVYIAWSVYSSRKESAAVREEFEHEFTVVKGTTGLTIVWQIGGMVVGLALLVYGARWLVDGAVTIARVFGMSELLIGLTIVAAGTSLPEVAASIVASIRGERDIAVGNIVGSNLFNIMCVLGLSSLIAPKGIEVSDVALRMDIPVMIAVAVACLPIFWNGLIARWEGGLFLAYYGAYTAYLILDATEPEMSRTFGAIMVGFVIPLTVITFCVLLVRSLRRKNGGNGAGSPGSSV